MSCTVLYSTCAYRLAALIENERLKDAFRRSTLHELRSLWCGCEVISSSLVSLSICLRRGLEKRSGDWLHEAALAHGWGLGAKSKPVKTHQNQGEQRGRQGFELSNLEPATVSGGTSSILAVIGVLLVIIGYCWQTGCFSPQIGVTKGLPRRVSRS